MKNKTNIIETKNLAYQVKGQQIIHNLDLRVPANSIYGFLGPNGSGKTTSIKLILGLLKVDRGKVFIMNKLFDNHRIEILSEVGSLIETPSLYNHLNAYDNLEYFRILYRVEKYRIEEVLKLVGLFDAKSKKVKAFSLGMKQRLAIAITLFHDPQIIFLDEPNNGLDPDGMQKMNVLITKLKEMGKTIFVASHLLSEMDKICTHIGIITQGKLIYQGEKDQLLAEQNSDNLEKSYFHLTNQFK